MSDDRERVLGPDGKFIPFPARERAKAERAGDATPLPVKEEEVLTPPPAATKTKRTLNKKAIEKNKEMADKHAKIANESN